MESVNYSSITMKKKDSKLLEEKVNQEFFCLQSTAVFLNSQRQKKESELIWLNKQLEQDYTDEKAERFNKCILEIKNIDKKVNWEKKQCQNFDKKIEDLNKVKTLEFTSQLAKKILAKRKKN